MNMPVSFAATSAPWATPAPATAIERLCSGLSRAAGALSFGAGLIALGYILLF